MIETWINIIANFFIAFSLLGGTFFIISSSIGIIRFPDIFTRLHASTKAATLGLGGILTGAFIFMYVEHNIVSGKLILGFFFILLTAPVSAHLISRAAHRSGVKPIKESARDEFEEYEKTKER